MTVGTGAPAAVHCSITMEPKVTFWDSGAFSILAKTAGEDKGTKLNGWGWSDVGVFCPQQALK